MKNKKSEILEMAAQKIAQTELPLRERLADAFNMGLIHLSELDFVEDSKRESFRKISDTLQAEDPGRMPTRAHRSAEMLSLDEATGLAAEIIDLSK